VGKKSLIGTQFPSVVGARLRDTPSEPMRCIENVSTGLMLSPFHVGRVLAVHHSTRHTPSAGGAPLHSVILVRVNSKAHVFGSVDPGAQKS